MLSCTRYYQTSIKASANAHMNCCNQEKGKTQHICNACRSFTVTEKAATYPGQLLKGDCLNVTESRLGWVKACLAMPWVYIYLASFVMTCKTLQVQQKQLDELYHASKARLTIPSTIFYMPPASVVHASQWANMSSRQHPSACLHGYVSADLAWKVQLNECYVLCHIFCISARRYTARGVPGEGKAAPEECELVTPHIHRASSSYSWKSSLLIQPSWASQFCQWTTACTPRILANAVKKICWDGNSQICRANTKLWRCGQALYVMFGL